MERFIELQDLSPSQASMGVGLISGDATETNITEDVDEYLDLVSIYSIHVIV